MKPIRSLLFVPGNKPDWMAKAPRYGADALVLDLEDAVPVTDKVATRPIVRRAIDDLKARDQTLYVRVNDLSTGLTADDLAGVVCAGLDGIMMPKVDGSEDVRRMDALLTYAEGLVGVPAGQIEIIASLESAKGLRNAYEIALAPRVATLMAGSSDGGDTSQSVGYIWTKEEQETLYFRSKAVLDGRAAGLKHLLVGLWSNIADLDGLERHCVRNRQLGFNGEVLIHPSHVPVVNRIYTPSVQEIADAEGLLQAMAEAERQGTAAVTYKGGMVDYAMVKTAQQLLDFARRVGAYPGKG